MFLTTEQHLFLNISTKIKILDFIKFIFNLQGLTKVRILKNIFGEEVEDLALLNMLI